MEASPSGDHQGAFPAGQALKPVPSFGTTIEWMCKHTELVQLGERETAYLSANTVLFDRANDLFDGALLNLETADSVNNIEWPLPPFNADGSAIQEDEEPFDQVQWVVEQHVIVGGAEDPEDHEHDGFIMEQQFDAQYFETDKYQEYPGYLGRATAEVQGRVHASGLQILPLVVGEDRKSVV